MQITSQSEWMLDQKHAEVMGPGKAFSVIQTSTGSSVFFSIGSDSRLYATREVTSGSTGWTRIDLSAALPTSSATVKTFVVAQNPKTLYFDLALVATTNGSDHLYLSLGNANTDDAWSQQGLKWSAIPFDDAHTKRDPDSIEIDGVYMMVLPAPGKPTGALTCFVDILRGPKSTNSLRLLDRYYITPGASCQWQKHTLAIDLSSGSVSSCLGRRVKDRVGGIYTLGMIGSKVELLFSPAYNVWDVNTPPSPGRLALPENATAVTSSLDAAGYSHLFVSGRGGIYYFPPDKQLDGAKGSIIIPTALVSGASHITAETAGGITAIYGQSPQGDLFYTSCKAGSEASPDAWSYPMPIVSDIENYAFFVNKQAGNNSVFAHVKERNIKQIVQDPITGDWASRAILLPSTDVDNIVSFSSFTTRITCQDKTGASLANAEVSLKGASPVGVYINGSYRILGPGSDIKASSDASGAITIVQPTQDMAAVCYQVAPAADMSTYQDVDPGSRIKDRLSAIQSGNQLQEAKVTQADGTVRSLIPSDVSKDDCEAAVTAIKQLMQVSNSLPKTGVQEEQSSTSTNISAIAASNQGDSALSMTVPPQGTGMTITAGRAIALNAKNIVVKVGDLFQSILHSAWNAVKDFVIRAVNGVHEVLVHIGDTIYRAVLNTVTAVTHAVQWVFTKLKVAWEDIKNFLGFVFNWGDIVRTHKVIKSVTTKYALDSISKITGIQSFIANSIDSLEGQINAWSGLPDSNITAGQQSSIAAQKIPASNDPQTHYISEKLHSNLDKASSSASAPDMDKSSWLKIVDELKDLALDQKEALLKAFDTIKAEIINKFTTLTPLEIVKRLLGIIGNLVLDVAKSLVVKTLDIVKDLTTAVIETLNEPISIPIISKLYKTVAGDELSIMDLICLVAAVPATLLYKVVTGSTPFPDNSITDSIIDAPDFSAIQNIMKMDPSVFKTLTIISEFSAMAGLGGHAIINSIRIPWMAEGKPGEVPELIRQVCIPVKLLSLMPSMIRPRSDNDPWEEKMDAAVTDLAFLKVCLDATTIGEKETYGTVSPFIDYAISAVWIIPTVVRIVSNHTKASSYLSLTTSVAYDVALMTGPIVWNPSLDPESKLIVLAASNGLLVVASGVSAARAGLLHDNE